MSICNACGAGNDDGSTFCISCGARLQNNAAPVQPVYVQPAHATSQPQLISEKPSKSCLVLGILSVVFSGMGLSYIFGPIAIAKAIKVVKKFGERKFATAAVVLATIGLLITSAQVVIIIIGSLGW